MTWTRSCVAFESDVLLGTVRDALRQRSAFGISPTTGGVTTVRLTRSGSSSSALETESHVRVRMPCSRRVAKAVFTAYQRGDEVQVLAYGPRANTVFHRGTFKVTSLNPKFVVLEKQWTKKENTPPTPVVAAAPAPVAAHAPALAPVVRAMPVTRFYQRPVMTTPLRPATTPLRPAATSSRPTNTASLRSIRTVHNGIEYRSRLEARFAQLLTALGIRFVYEPMKLNQASGGTYTIDFFFPQQQLYVELKPKRPHLEEEAKCERMSRAGFRVVLMYGSSVTKLPFRSELFMGRNHRDYMHHDAMRGMAWIDGVKLAGETVFVCGPASRPTALTPPNTSTIYLDQVASTDDMRWKHESIAAAMRSLYE